MDNGGHYCRGNNGVVRGWSAGVVGDSGGQGSRGNSWVRPVLMGAASAPGVDT